MLGAAGGIFDGKERGGWAHSTPCIDTGFGLKFGRRVRWASLTATAMLDISLTAGLDAEGSAVTWRHYPR